MFLLVCVAGFALRLFIAVSTTYLWDEDRDWIPLAEQISLRPNSLSLPIRGEYHPAVPAYGIALGRSILGKNELGSRGAGVLVGTLTIVLLAVAARWLGGNQAMLVTAALVAFNEYHVQVSALATEKAYYLFFSALAMVSALRFLRDPQSRFLFATAVATALALLSKELALFLVVALFVGLLADRPHTFREPRLAVAILIGGIILLPEIWWNLSPHTARADYAGHLSRFDGFGITVQPVAFYFSSEISWAMTRVGRTLVDFAPEYIYMNGLFGLVLVAGVAVSALGIRHVSALGIRHVPRERGLVLLLCCFAVPIVALSVINTREVAGLDGQLPFWSDLSLLAASVLAGVWVARGTALAKVALTLVVAAACWSTWRLVAKRAEMPASQFVATPLILMPDSAFHDVGVRSNVCYACSPIESLSIGSVIAVEAADTLPASRIDRDVIRDGAAGLRVRAAVSPGAVQRAYLIDGTSVRANGETLPWRVGTLVPAGAPPFRPTPVW